MSDLSHLALWSKDAFIFLEMTQIYLSGCIKLCIFDTFLIHSSVDGCINHFQALAIISSAIIHGHIYITVILHLQLFFKKSRKRKGRLNGISVQFSEESSY